MFRNESPQHREWKITIRQKAVGSDSERRGNSSMQFRVLTWERFEGRMSEEKSQQTSSLRGLSMEKGGK